MPEAARRQPNIVLVMADQLAPHFTGAYGHPLVQTPAMEAQAERWDSAEIRERVLCSQRRRRVLHAAAEAGGTLSWDYNPVRDAANEYVRTHMDWAEAGPRSRYPRLERTT